MSGIMEHILMRRSIRKYSAEPVPREVLEQLLQAGMAAPTANNRKPWEFVVVTESQRLKAVRARLIFGPYQPMAMIITCGNMRHALPPPARNFWIEDCSAAMQNMWLAASGLGLGAVWIGVYPLGIFVKGVQQALGLPKGVIPLGVLYLGYPGESKEARSQYDAKRIHWENY